MNFMIYDITLLVIFVIAVSIFLYIRRKNLKREGLLLLYKTSHGISFINRIGNKYKKTLKVLSYASITLGYILMASMIYLFGKIVYIYIFQQNVVQAVKIPPITPLIPYLPQIFSLNFLPPFYFTYWIVIIAIVAIVHEFSHGIFAAYSNVRIKKTGFGFFPFFLPVFLAAFVELDENQMGKKKKKDQLAILSAGTFSNVLTAVVFFFLLWGFFSVSFVPAGVNFDTYSFSAVNISNIYSINGVQMTAHSYNEILSLTNNSGFNRIVANNESYILTKSFLQSQQNVKDYVLLYEDSPAIESNLSGAITEVNGVKITSKEKLAQVIYSYKPGDKLDIKTTANDVVSDYNIILGKNPDNKIAPWLGIGFNVQQNKGLMNTIYNVINLMKEPNVYYAPRYNAAVFIYDLLWWLVLICVSVALVNMLPVGIFDGGRFLYLTVWGITKDENKAKKVFKFLTYAFLFLLLVIMVFWAISMFK